MCFLYAMAAAFKQLDASSAFLNWGWASGGLRVVWIGGVVGAFQLLDLPRICPCVGPGRSIFQSAYVRACVRVRFSSCKRVTRTPRRDSNSCGSMPSRVCFWCGGAIAPQWERWIWVMTHVCPDTGWESWAEFPMHWACGEANRGCAMFVGHMTGEHW